jgi:hypothetical protein
MINTKKPGPVQAPVIHAPATGGPSGATKTTATTQTPGTSATQGPGGQTSSSSGAPNLNRDQVDDKKATAQDTSATAPFKSKEDVAQLNSRRGSLFKSRSSEDVSKLALVGHGSSIAYQLDTMPKEVDHSKTALIGEQDAWSKAERGDGFINHESQQIDHTTDKSPRFSNKYMERQELVEMNQGAFDRAKAKGARVVNDEVTSVSREGGLIKIQTKDGSSVLAEKAILGTGAGPHYGFGSGRGPVLPSGIPPQDKAKEEAALKGKVVDLDEYMRQFPRTPEMEQSLDYQKPSSGDHVVVHGPNAGIDAVQRAWQHGAKVTWLSGKTEPVFLAGNRLPIEDVYKQHKDDPNGPIHFAMVGRTNPTVRANSEGGLDVSYTPTGAKEPVNIKASHYVISLGQNAMAPGAIGDVLKKGGIGASDLEPIYDVNQRFGQTYQTALGLQLKGTNQGQGLQITGAAAASLAAAFPRDASIKNNYQEQFPLSDKATPAEGKHMMNAERYLEKMSVPELLEHQVNQMSVPAALRADPNSSTEARNFHKMEGIATPGKPATTALPSTVVSPQLGAVRASVAAQQGHMPGYISQGKANFSSDDRTMLATHMAQKYPHLTNGDIEEHVQKIMDARASKEPGGPAGSVLGFTDEATQQFEAQLAALNKQRSST